MKTDAMEDRCRCPVHVLGKAPAVCPNKARLKCPHCKVALCLDCATDHHPRHHHAAPVTEGASA